jgi:hypothetical protein
MILAVTAARARQSPTIRFHEFDRISDLHFNFDFVKTSRLATPADAASATLENGHNRDRS